MEDRIEEIGGLYRQATRTWGVPWPFANWPVLAAFPVAVMRHFDKSYVQTEDLFWFTVQECSPPWREVKVTGV